MGSWDNHMLNFLIKFVHSNLVTKDCVHTKLIIFDVNKPSYIRSEGDILLLRE